MSGKLHELLAVEPSLEGAAKRVLEETIVTFKKKQTHFSKSHKTYNPLTTDEPGQPEEISEMVTTVPDKLDYMFTSLTKFWDATIQKEATNQIAKADLIVDNDTIAKDVPATALLSLESKLSSLRKVFDEIQTHPPGNKWEVDKDEDSSGNVYKGVHAIEKNRAVKTFKSKILVEPTEFHPAQIEKWEELEVVGRYNTQYWTGTISPAKKSDYLVRIDKLIRATKKARMRANNVDVVKINISDKIKKYILE